ITSNGHWPSSAAAISLTSNAILPASLRTGTTTATVGSSAFIGKALLGQQCARNGFDAAQRWPGPMMHGAVGPDRKNQPSQRETAAHQQCDGDPDQSAGQHVAWKMRGHHHAANRNQQNIDPQYGACV